MATSKKHKQQLAKKKAAADFVAREMKRALEDVKNIRPMTPEEEKQAPEVLKDAPVITIPGRDAYKGKKLFTHTVEEMTNPQAEREVFNQLMGRFYERPLELGSSTPDPAEELLTPYEKKLKEMYRKAGKKMLE